MWQKVPILYRDAFLRAQFVERIGNYQIWNLHDTYYLLEDETFQWMFSEASGNLDYMRRIARSVAMDRV